MSKRVRAAELLGVRINETELEILRLFGRMPGARPMALRTISTGLSKSKATVHCSLRHLTERGLVETHRRFLSNGGQLENEYEVTDLGRRILDVTKND